MGSGIRFVFGHLASNFCKMIKIWSLVVIVAAAVVHGTTTIPETTTSAVTATAATTTETGTTTVRVIAATSTAGIASAAPSILYVFSIFVSLAAPMFVLGL